MNQEQFDMLQRLKRPIDGYMGEWRDGDLYIAGKDYKVLVYRSDYYNWIKGDDILRIPPLCTSDGKRCLWDMMDWTKWYCETCHGTLDIYTDGEIFCIEQDPYTAILKALYKQEGV